MQQWLVGNTASLSFVWQDGVSPMPKDRGAEQGDGSADLWYIDDGDI